MRNLKFVLSIFALSYLSLSAVAQPQSQVANKAPVSFSPTLQNFAALPFVENPELSPNGRYMAARVSVDKKQFLGIIGLYSDAPKKQVIVDLMGDTAKVDVDWWNWVNDDWLLIGVSAVHVIEGQDFKITRLIAMDATTGKMKYLARDAKGQNASNVIWTASDGTPRILLSVQKSIYDGPDFWPEVQEIDVSTGKSKTVEKSRVNVSRFYADSTGTVRLAYGYDDQARSAKLLYRAQPKEPLKVIDRANYKNDEEIVFPALFLQTPDQALTINNDDGFDALYELDLKTLKRGNKIFGVSGYDIDGIVRSPTSDVAMGVYLTEKASRIHWLDAEMAKIQKSIDSTVAPRKASIVSWSRDMSTLLILLGGIENPGAYFLFDKTRGKLERVAYVDEKIKNYKLATPTTIQYKAQDGLNISAVLTLPVNRPAKSLPLILMPHGGPSARDSESWDWWVQFLAWRGYAVVQPNYRGSTGFGKDFEAKGDGEWGLKMQDDLNSAVDHLAKLGTIDPKRVCIAGASYGGYAALRGAERDGARFRCAISYAGVSDLAAMRNFDAQFLNSNSAKAYWKSQAPNFAAVSPVNNPKNFSSPTLIMHGKEDLRVPVSQSRRMADKLKSAGKSFKYVEQSLGDHHFSREADRVEFLREMQAWLDIHNPPD